MTDDQKNKLKGFDNVLQVLSREDKDAFLKIASYMYSVSPDDVVRYNYAAGGEPWYVWESPKWKTVGNASRTYNGFFSKTDGFTCKFGTHAADDPEWCPLGPDIADIEVVAGKCPKINGRNCAFCYKNNGGDEAFCMKLAEFKELVDFMPRNLCQIAFGITGYYTNPEFLAMMEYAKSRGIVPNYTTNGVDLDNDAVARTIETCGRVAVSCYEGAKDVCYGTVKRFGDAAKAVGREFPCNIHVVLSKDTFPHVMSVLEDARDGKIPNLGAVVVLRMKPVGRAKVLDCVIPKDMYRRITDFCLGAGVRFGFDSCGAKPVADILAETGRTDLLGCVETCESSRFSSYFNWKREYWNCSFCENNAGIMKAVDPFSFGDFQSFWNSRELDAVRFPPSRACASCPWYALD